MQTRRWIPKKVWKSSWQKKDLEYWYCLKFNKHFLAEESMLSLPLKSRPLLENNLDKENGYHGQSTLHILWR